MAVLAAGMAVAQRAPVAPGAPAAPQVVTLEQPDAQRTRQEFRQLLDQYPPTLRSVLALDPSLLQSPAYLTPYPSLVTYLSAHPEIARDPTFYVGEPQEYRNDPSNRVFEIWRNVFDGLAVFAGFGMAISLIVWLIRTLIDYRRWSRLAKVQTDVHTKLLDRFMANEDLLAYIQSPAGSKFLESSPIKLDAGPRTMGAPLGRIMWSLQGGLVLMSAGIGLQYVGRHVASEAVQPLNALGVLALALGAGFVISAIISYVISQRLGLIERPPAQTKSEPPSA